LVSKLSLIRINGKRAIALNLLGIKYFETISIIIYKVVKFVFMIDQNNENKLIEGEDYYFTPEGYRCFTEKYHLKRGYCKQKMTFQEQIQQGIPSVLPQSKTL
jgi:hypothetical protein